MSPFRSGLIVTVTLPGLEGFEAVSVGSSFCFVIARSWSCRFCNALYSVVSWRSCICRATIAATTAPTPRSNLDSCEHEFVAHSYTESLMLRPSTKSASAKACSTKCGGYSVKRGNCSPGRNPMATTEAQLSRYARYANVWNRSARCWRRRIRPVVGRPKASTLTLACSAMRNSTSRKLLSQKPQAASPGNLKRWRESPRGEVFAIVRQKATFR